MSFWFLEIGHVIQSGNTLFRCWLAGCLWFWAESCQWFKESKIIVMVHPLFLFLFFFYPLFLMPLPLELSCPVGFQYLFDLAIFFIPNCVTSLYQCFWVCHNSEDFWWQSQTCSIWRLKKCVELKQEFGLRQIPCEQSRMPFISNSCFPKPTGNKYE